MGLVVCLIVLLVLMIALPIVGFVKTASELESQTGWVLCKGCCRAFKHKEDELVLQLNYETVFEYRSAGPYHSLSKEIVDRPDAILLCPHCGKSLDGVYWRMINKDGRAIVDCWSCHQEFSRHRDEIVSIKVPFQVPKYKMYKLYRSLNDEEKSKVSFIDKENSELKAACPFCREQGVEVYSSVSELYNLPATPEKGANYSEQVRWSRGR